MENRNAYFEFDERPSDSPYVACVWRTQYEGAGGEFLSIAENHWEMVITKENGHITLTIRGPETHATPAPIPESADFVGIHFKMGTFMPHLPNINLVNHAITLPEAHSKGFWLQGSVWDFPTFDNADVFVDRLVREGVLVHDPVVDDALQGHLPELSMRSVQRRFLRATGLTHGTAYQIERAKQATILLGQGVSILDTVMQLGYADQPHLTRSLKRFLGQTPAQLLRLPTVK